MKNILAFVCFNLISSFQLLAPANAHDAVRNLIKVELPVKVLARGAANPNELAQNILQAIQHNKFEELSSFLLADEELVLLKKRGSEDMKAFLENSSVDNIKSNLQTDYQKLIESGISNTINWSDLVVAETRLGKSAAKNAYLQPITVVLMDKQNRPMQLVIDTVKLNNRYFLFRQINLKA